MLLNLNPCRRLPSLTANLTWHARHASTAARPCASLARAIKAVPITLITVSKDNSPGARLMSQEWADKLRRYTALEEVVIKPNPKNSKDPAIAKAHEGERVLRALRPGDRVILLDERGKDLASEGLARLLAAAGDEGRPALAFVIGGPHGHGDAVRARADETVRLSSMVLNHAVARVVLLEQLYRGWTILRGEPYHH